MQTMMSMSKLVSEVEKGSHQEQEATHQEGDLDSVLQYLNVGVYVLVKLAWIMDGPNNP